VVSFFRDKSPAAIFWLIIICFALHLNSLLNPPQIVIQPIDGFFYYLLQPLQNADAYFASLLYVIMIFLLALQLNFMLNSLHMLPKPTYTPALAFILFTGLLPSLNMITPALFACNLCIWILYRACKLYAAPNPKTAIYNFGLLNGLCAILYYPALPFLIIALFALMIMRSFKPTEWFVLLFGILTPAYFLGGYLFLTGQLHLLPQLQQVFALIQLPVQPLLIIISLCVAALATMWGFFSVQHSGGNALIQVRKSWSVFFVALIFTIPVLFFIKGAFPAAFLLAAIPAASYAGFALGVNRNILPVIFFWILLGLSVYSNWFAVY